jgi:cell division protein FtsB
MRARSVHDGAGPKPSTKGGRLVETAFRRKALVLAAFLIVAATVLNSLFGERGIFGLWKAREEHDQLLREVEALESENDRLSEQIHALRKDPLVVERLARETLGMAREGEIVLTIRHPEPR